MEIKEAIDAAKAYLNDCPTFCDECDNEYCEVPEIKRLLDEMYNELKWYRNQDLIPRKDVLVRIAQAVSPSDIYTKIFITLKQIPKAEYKGDNNDNR